MITSRPLHGVITDKQVSALNERNLIRARETIVAMGLRYACHPSNHVQRITSKGKQ